MQLALASVFTLGLQAALLFALIAGYGVMTGSISIWVGFGIVILYVPVGRD